MCEVCTTKREEAWAEIRDLLNFNRKVKGPLSERVAAQIEESRSDPNCPDDATLKLMVEAIRAQMIADRCVAIARSCPGTSFHQLPPSMIMGAWAGELMNMEMSEQANSILGLFLGNLFGGLPGDSDDE